MATNLGRLTEEVKEKIYVNFELPEESLHCDLLL